MFARLRAEIRMQPAWAQPLAWVTYFCIWLICQIFVGLWWLLSETYGQATTALGRLIRPMLLPGMLILVALLLYALAPSAFNGMLNLAIIVGVMWLAVNMTFSGFRKPKKKKGAHE